MNRIVRRVGVATGAVVLAVASLAPYAGQASSAATAAPVLDCLPAPTALIDPDLDPFYQAPNPIPAVAPGTVIRCRPVRLTGLGVPLPYQAWQLLFVSTDINGQPATAVTTVILPLGGVKKGAPLVSYQVAEDSAAQKCAPSFESRQGIEKEEPSWPGLLAQGWVVSVPDYEGPRSEYGVGKQAGIGVLDGVRAALHFAPDGLTPTSKVGLWGYSGGALASGWAAELQSSYAPELNIVGVSEGGIPAVIKLVARNVDGTAFSGLEIGASGGIARGYPQLLTLLNNRGRAAMKDVYSKCLEQVVVEFSFKKLDMYTVVPDAIDIPWVSAIINAQNMGQRKPVAPMFMYHAVNDEIVPISGTNALVTRYCAEGVKLIYYQDLLSEHNSLAITGAPEAVSFLNARFRGYPMFSTCGLPLLP